MVKKRCTRSFTFQAKQEDTEKKKKKTVFTISLKARGFLEARLPFFFCTDKEMKEEKTPFKYARSSFISHFKPLFF